MWLPDKTYLPLLYKHGLSYLGIRKPTEEEIATLTIYDVNTDDWDPADQCDKKWVFKDDEASDGDDPNDPDNLPDNIKKCQGESKQGGGKRPPFHGKIWKLKTQSGFMDMDHLQRCLGWKSADVIEKTMKATTQLADNQVQLPMRMHFKSRFPALNVRRLNEVYATDTFFSSVKALGGFNMAQLYVGKTSTFTEFYGMKTENQMSETLQDFIRQWGAPSGLLLDGAKAETSKVVKDILCLYGIKGMQSEANHQHQNYAERRIQEVKSTANIIMDRINAPSFLWYLCLKYVVMVLNHLATPSLNNITLIEGCFGVTPDISGLLQFYFYQPIFYLDTNKPAFPKSKELLGHWVGLIEHIGDALTYWIVIIEHQLIACSTLCPAYHPGHQNLRQAEGDL